jgi:hypothetical protein
VGAWAELGYHRYALGHVTVLSSFKTCLLGSLH